MYYKSLIIILCLLVNASYVRAQYSDGTDVIDNSERSSETEVYALYRMNRVTSDVGVWGSDFDATTLHGIGAGYSITRNIAHRSNFNVTMGADVVVSTSASQQFWDKTDDNYTWYHETAKANLTTLVFKIPVSIGYDFHCSPKLITLRPFAGISCNAHMFVRGRISTTNNYGDSHQWVDLLYADSTHDSFCNMLAIDWHVGLKCRFTPRYSVALSFNRYFSPVYKSGDTNVRTWSVDLKLAKRI